MVYFAIIEQKRLCVLHSFFCTMNFQARRSFAQGLLCYYGTVLQTYRLNWSCDESAMFRRR